MPVAKAKVKSSDDNLTIIIPVAGKPTRQQCPALCEINGQRLINYQISTLRKIYPQSDICIVVGYERDKIISCLTETVKIVENENYGYNNTARSVQLGLQVCPHAHNLLLVHGDIYFNAEAVRKMFSDYSSLCVDQANLQDDTCVGLLIQDESVIRCSYTERQKWSHIAYFNKQEFEILKALLNKGTCGNFFSEELVNIIIDEGGKFKAHYPTKGIALEVYNYDPKTLPAIHDGAIAPCR
jgi:choline kinase